MRARASASKNGRLPMLKKYFISKNGKLPILGIG